MTSPFARLAGMARAQTARLSGEAAEFLPMVRTAGPNGAATPDPLRDVVSIVAVFAEEPALAFESQRVASFAPTASAGTTVTACFDVGGLDIRVGDRLRRLADETSWMIVERQPDGLGGIACRLAIAV